MNPLRERATADLRRAMQARDKDAVSALRTLLGAFSNAEAVSSTARAGAIEASAAVGETEVQRRALSDADVRQIVVADVAERRSAAVDAAAYGHDDTAARLRRQADLIETLILDV